MDLREAETLARRLMAEHGLTAKGWRFGWDSARRRFGAARPSSLTISLSVPLVSLNDEARVRNTILHEIAHALAGPGIRHEVSRFGRRRKKADWHGPHWRAIALAIGCDGKTCFSSETTNRPVAPYEQFCRNCDWKRPAFRRSSKRQACSRCCRAHGSKGFDERFVVGFRAASVTPVTAEHGQR